EQVSYIREMPEGDQDERAEKEEAIQQYLENMTEAEKDELLQQKVRECDEDHKRVVALGGLHIVGTERHESPRIDNQLRGRAGRQGDPGSSRFFLALDDDLMRIFGGERIKNMMNMLRVADDEPIESRLVSKQIEGAQTKVEGHNFDARRYLVEYDDVMNKQREIIYGERRKVLEGVAMRDLVLSWV